MGKTDADVVVVGAGNAALCAALAAAEGGASVLVLEAAPQSECGGNTAYTAGAMRVVYKGTEDIKLLVPELSESELAATDFGKYTESDFFHDMARVTEYRADPDLVEALVKGSFETLQWMRGHGVRFLPMYGRQAFKVDGRFKFWGGLTLETRGGGPGLVDCLTDACARLGVTIRYSTRAVGLVRDGDKVSGVRVRSQYGVSIVRARSVVLACGGFEANAEWRTRYLGPGWDLAKVRGSRFNIGDGIKMALAVGASAAGNWSGAHAVAWDMNAPEFGDLRVGDGFQKHSYPLGIMVNSEGNRFVDEGADFRNYTYAKYGQAILRQSHQVAWQIFDGKVSHLLRDEYRIRELTSCRADSVEELAHKMEGVDADRLIGTIDEYNRSVDTSTPFDPNVRDGRGTKGIAPKKSNWANRIDTPPFEAFTVTCGITFSFGGLRIDADSAQVVDVDGRLIPGLYACGELVGGLFYFNYPGGTGLTSGSVFGRKAGYSAAHLSAPSGSSRL